MADEEVKGEEGEAPKKKKGGLIIGLVLALAGAGGGFAFTSGMLGGDTEAKPKLATIGDDLAFVPIEPMTVSLGDTKARRYLRFRAQLEVDALFKSDIEKVMPRVVDVLNTYLQSLKLADIEDPSSLLTLRSQMRRRIDLVVGGDRVHDLLVMEFVVN